MIQTREKIFALNYIKYGVGKTAAVMAGWKPNSAYVMAHRMLRKPEIQEFIRQEEAKILAEINITVDEVVEQYKAIAFADIKNYYENIYTLIETSAFDSNSRKRKKYRLLQHIGYKLTEEEYESLPASYKRYYQGVYTIIPFDRLTKEQRIPIAGLTYDKSGREILKLSPKERSLEALGQYLNMNDINKKSSSDTPDVLEVKVTYE